MTGSENLGIEVDDYRYGMDLCCAEVTEGGKSAVLSLEYFEIWRDFGDMYLSEVPFNLDWSVPSELYFYTIWGDKLHVSNGGEMRKGAYLVVSPPMAYLLILLAAGPLASFARRRPFQS